MKLELFIIGIVVLSTSVCAYHSELKDMRETASWLKADNPKQTIRNTQVFVVNYVMYEEQKGRSYAEAWQTWRDRKGDCTEISELTRVLLRYNEVAAYPVRMSDGMGHLHDALFTEYGLLYEIPGYRLNGGGYW